MILNKPLHSLSFLAMLVGLALSGCGLELPSNDAPAPATVEVLPVPTPTVAATQAPQQAEDNQEAPEFPCEEEKKFCIGLVSELGTIDDKSFNQSAWQGLERASADLAAHIEYIETTTPIEYEPSIALFSENNGLYDIFNWTEKAGYWLRPGGMFLLEFGDGQCQKIVNFFESLDFFVEYSVHRDYSNLYRYIVAKKK